MGFGPQQKGNCHYHPKHSDLGSRQRAKGPKNDEPQQMTPNRIKNMEKVNHQQLQLKWNHLCFSLKTNKSNFKCFNHY